MRHRFARRCRCSRLNASPQAPSASGGSGSRECEAQRLSLLSDVVAADQLDAAVERELDDLLQCAPGAVAATKKLVAYVHAHDLPTNMIYTADKLADAWETDEGREGIVAFFAKRPPFWRQP